MFPVLALFLTNAVQAFESDQLTDRGEPLADATALANAKADEMMAIAIAETNRKTGCKGTNDEMHLALAREVHKVFGEKVTVPARGKLPPMVFGAYAAWLEVGPLERRTFADRQDIYSLVQMGENAILVTVGPCSTLRFGDFFVGTDKIDHFLVQGYMYFHKSRWGRNEDRAIRWGTMTERLWWGSTTTNIFSYADLAANYGGFNFYNTLLDPNSVATLALDGCVQANEAWDWSRWINWHFDEFLNPSGYKPDILLALRRYLEVHEEEVCADYQKLPPTWLFREEEELQEMPTPYVEGAAPMRLDPFDLESFCNEAQSPMGEPTETGP